ncbi:uncharacterized protein LOC119329583 [Triticum dicoccoides]|uniref:uncharacterized protein LOC119329583 n=1 Tax=Triticum dicoccoides TaxID=85692 RepID=UPI000E78D262|nr:uncharacterized protein LOC119329583 [Triticum dicoccoides]
MNRMRRIAGMGKSKKAPSAVQKDKDESIVFFRELYKHEEDTDVNLLEPIYSVEFDAIQGGHMSKPPSGKRDLLMPIIEKHDYDWPKTPPVAPMFPSLKMEASSSETVVAPKVTHIPITQPVKPSASRFIGKTEATKTSAKTPAGSSSSNSAKSQPCTTDRRPASAYATLPNRQQKPDAKANTGTSSNSGKEHSHTYYANASQDSSSSSASTTNTVETPGEAPYTAPKNLLTTGSIFARRRASATAVATAPPLGVDTKVESAKARRPPSSAARASKELQVDARKNALPAKGKAVAGTGSEPVCNSSGRASTSKTAPAKGMRRTDGKNERRPNFADQ